MIPQCTLSLSAIVWIGALVERKRYCKFRCTPWIQHFIFWLNSQHGCLYLQWIEYWISLDSRERFWMCLYVLWLRALLWLSFSLTPLLSEGASCLHSPPVSHQMTADTPWWRVAPWGICSARHAQTVWEMKHEGETPLVYCFSKLVMAYDLWFGMMGTFSQKCWLPMCMVFQLHLQYVT